MKKAVTLLSDSAGFRLYSFARTLFPSDSWSITAIRVDAPDEYTAAQMITKYCREQNPDVLLFPSTTAFRIIAPMTAAMLQTGLTADCTALSVNENGLLVQTRPALGGSLTADILCASPFPQMATVREDALALSLGSTADDVHFVTLSSSPQLQPAIRLIRETFSGVKGEDPLRSARIIFSGGKGVGSAEGFEKLRRLAALVKGASVGASRGAVSANYAPYRYQVGLTGEIVRPDVYVAFGISGAVQHLAGMQNSKKIIAINTDPNAPIFDYADIAVVAPWEQTADILIKLFMEDPVE